MDDCPFKLTPLDDLKTVRACLTTPESVEAFYRLEFQLKTWRIHRIVFLERLNQISDGIQVGGELYIKFSTACAILGE